MTTAKSPLPMPLAVVLSRRILLRLRTTSTTRAGVALQSIFRLVAMAREVGQVTNRIPVSLKGASSLCLPELNRVVYDRKPSSSFAVGTR